MGKPHSSIEKIQAGGIITALPLYHIFSLTANCLTFFTFGICNILITNPKDIPGFIKELKRQPFIAMTGVNTLFNALLHHPKFSTVDFSHLILALGGGMATQKPVAMRWKQLTGSPIVEAYGLTEASPAVTINPLNTEVFSGSIGLPLPSTNIKICDETGQELPLGEIGELYIQGPQVMAGYWNTPETTDQQLLKSGWLKSGDLAYVNDKGFVYIVDRKKDMINVSGFNVYPNEVEDVIMHLAGVKEVAVIGISDETHGEIVKAFVVRDKTVNPPITAEAVIAHAHESLTGYKVPKLIEFKEELPKTNVGKVLRRALREH